MALLGLDTFPKKGIFLLYMALWCGLRIFVYASKNLKSAPKYNSTSLLVFVCIAKLFMATGMYMRNDGTLKDMVEKLVEHRNLFLRYSLPAVSYVLYDNLTFVNLTLFDPVTYVILMQIRLVVTGVMWSALFSKKLSTHAWLALALITIGCMVKESGKFFDPNQKKDAHAAADSTTTWLAGLAMIALQVGAGVFASVFNETLLKKQPQISVNLQNVFMYLHSIVANAVVLAFKGELTTALHAENLWPILSPYVFPIGLIMATIGIVTSWFLKYLDSIRKTIASALEIFVDALMTWVLFGIPVGFTTVCATFLVSGGIYLYSRPADPEPEPEPEDAEDAVVQSPNGRAVAANIKGTGPSATI
uniref:Uncharacterized protein n=1 Tax=Eutreptiella gymnastica TaxID=73025 RepID=A0A7S4FQ23_9EUGL